MNRSGKTLLEMMIVMTMLSSVLLICGQTLTAMFRAETKQAQAYRRMTAQCRLADRFRTDVHAATEARSIAGEGDAARVRQVVLSMPDGRTVTFAAGPQVTRTVRKGDDRVAFDAWPLGAEEVRFEVAEEGMRAILSFAVPPSVLSNASGLPAAENQALADAAARRELFNVEAVVGFDARFGRDEK